MAHNSSLFVFLRRIANNDKVRFLFFMEKNPKHRVSDTLPTVCFMALSLITFGCGLLAFSLFPLIGIFGIVGFMGVVMLGTLEIFHIIYDR